MKDYDDVLLYYTGMNHHRLKSQSNNWEVVLNS